MSATMTVKIIIKNIAKCASNMFRGKRRKGKVMKKIKTLKEKVKNAMIEFLEDASSEEEMIGLILVMAEAIKEALEEGVEVAEKQVKERIKHEQERNTPGE